MGPGQFDPRIDAQGLGQFAPGVRVDLQRLGLPAAAVQGQHQLGAQPLTQREFGHQFPQLRDEFAVPAERQAGRRPVLQRRKPQLLQPGRLRGGERRLPHVGERRPAPQSQRLPQQPGRPFVRTGRQRRPAGGCEPGEPVRVDLVGIDREPVPGRVVLDVLAQRGPQPGDLGLEGVRHPRRRMRTVEPVGEPPDGNGPARVEQQQGEQGPAPRTAERDRAATGVPRPRLPQNPESHPAILAQRRPAESGAVHPTQKVAPVRTVPRTGATR